MRKPTLARLLSRERAIVAILAIFLLVRIIYALRVHTVIWDEAVYIGIGKYIYSLGGAGLWETIRPLGLPVILGFLWKLGANLIVAGEAVALVFSMLSILLVYLIGRNLFGKAAGIVAAAFFALTPVFFLYSSYILTEIPSTFFVLLAVYLYVCRNSAIGAGISSALAMLFRFPQGIALLAFGIILGIGFL